jgi:hypothetical protein
LGSAVTRRFVWFTSGRVELAKAFQPVRDGRIHIEKINGPFLTCTLGSTTIRATFQASLPSCRSQTKIG